MGQPEPQTRFSKDYQKGDILIVEDTLERRFLKSINWKETANP